MENKNVLRFAQLSTELAQRGFLVEFAELEVFGDLCPALTIAKRNLIISMNPMGQVNVHTLAKIGDTNTLSISGVVDYIIKCFK